MYLIRFTAIREENSFFRTLTEETTVHVVPVFGLYAREANQITVSLLDKKETENCFQRDQ